MSIEICCHSSRQRFVLEFLSLSFATLPASRTYAADNVARHLGWVSTKSLGVGLRIHLSAHRHLSLANYFPRTTASLHRRLRIAFHRELCCVCTVPSRFATTARFAIKRFSNFHHASGWPAKCVSIVACRVSDLCLGLDSAFVRTPTEPPCRNPAAGLGRFDFVRNLGDKTTLCG